MTPLSKAVAFIVSLVMWFSASLAHADAPLSKRSVNIHVLQSSTEAATMAWTAYAISLAHSLETSGLIRTVPDGNYAPTFEVEFTARATLLRIWRKAIAKQPESDPYMDVLMKVEDAGFLRQYVWRFHSLPTWNKEEAPPDLDAFDSWAVENLKGHKPKTSASLTVSTGN